MKTEQTKKGAVRIIVEEDMVIGSAQALKAAFLDALLGARGTLELDLSGVSEMDTAGFQLLLMLRREALARKKGMRIINHSPSTANVAALYNMHEFLD